MNLKTITSAALLALAATGYMAPASAVPVLCEDVNVNHMLVDSASVQGCIDAGVGNIGNGQNDDFLNAGNTGWTDITGQLSFFTTQAGSTGSWGFIAPNPWDTFDELAIGFKFGTGNQPDEWFVYLLQSDVTSGLWEFVNVFGKGGGLSHLTFYAGEGTTTVPEPATLLLFGLGLLSLGFARRKKA